MNPTGPYLIATIHRPDNTDEEVRLREIVAALRDLSAPVVLLAHPRLVARASAFSIDLTGGALHPVTPLAYPQMVRAVMGSAGVVTDSGGLQKEAFLLGAPCTTLRTETEWVENPRGWLERPGSQARPRAGGRGAPSPDSHAVPAVWRRLGRLKARHRAPSPAGLTPIARVSARS